MTVYNIHVTALHPSSTPEEQRLVKRCFSTTSARLRKAIAERFRAKIGKGTILEVTYSHSKEVVPVVAERQIDEALRAPWPADINPHQGEAG